MSILGQDQKYGASLSATWDELALTDHHRAELVKSGISPEVARERGYRTATTIREVKRLGFGESQCQVPGLLIPIYTLGSEIVSYQFKPDTPRIKDGKPNKYESPSKSLCQLDVPPRARTWILDPQQPLVFTEGVKKGDSAASHEIACLDVAGVWNWRSVDVVATLDQIALKGRTVYLAFDSDYQRNAQVRAAKKRLAAVLRQRGAVVYDILLPEPTPGIKVGLDDYLANVGSQIDLFQLDMVELTGDADDETSREVVAGSYAATPAGIVYRKPTQHGPVDQLLSNFTARIVEEVIADDGASERAELAIEGELGGKPLPRILVPSRRFSSLDWVNEKWGARPIVNAGMGNRDRVREGIQRLSPDIEPRHVFEHSGWRNLPGLGWCYLHAGGAIGSEGHVSGVDVSLHGPASRISFPEPIDDDELRAAFRAEMALLDLAPSIITVPLLGSVYRSLLCAIVPADTSPYMVGPTGVFKSELAASAMQHFGTGFNRLHLPANWSATANYLEKVAFDFKDVLLFVDDFAPSGTQHDVARQHATAERVFRGAGNRGGRGRMNADSSLRTDYPPRGVIGATGEDIPRGHSLRSRMVIIEVAPGDVCREGLAAAQVAGQRGAFVGLLGRFIQHLAATFDELSASLPEKLTEYRQLAHQEGAHARTPEAVANLALGWEQFLKFTMATGLTTRGEARDMFGRIWEALGDVAERQTSHQVGEEPARRFMDLLRSALAGGFAHVADPNGTTPFPFAPWGWRHVRIGAGENERADWQEKGTRIGWVDGDDLYLDLEAALTATQRVGQATGSGVSLGAKTLAKRLHQRGYLRSIDSERDRLHVRRTLQGARRSVLHLSASSVVPEESTQSTQDKQEPAAPSHSPTGNGSIPWADLVGTGEESTQEIDPIAADRGGNGSIGTVIPA
jgi:hypothetical protein